MSETSTHGPDDRNVNSLPVVNYSDASKSNQTPRNSTTFNQTRLECLSSIEAEDWVPPVKWQRVAKTFGKAKVPADDPFSPAWITPDHARERQQQLAQFTRDFFTLEPVARQREWDRQWQLQQEYPSNLVWLQHLKTGLYLIREDSDSVGAPDSKLPTARQAIFQLFLLRPPERAKLLRQLLANWHRLSKERDEVRQFLKNEPELQRLVPEFAYCLLGPTSVTDSQARARLDRETLEVRFQGANFHSLEYVNPFSPSENMRSSAQVGSHAQSRSQQPAQGGWRDIRIVLLIAMLLGSGQGVLKLVSSFKGFSSGTYSQGPSIQQQVDKKKILEKIENNPKYKKAFEHLHRAIVEQKRGIQEQEGKPDKKDLNEVLRDLYGQQKIILESPHRDASPLSPNDKQRLDRQVNKERREIQQLTKESVGGGKAISLTVPDPALSPNSFWLEFAISADSYELEREQREVLSESQDIAPELLFLLPPVDGNP